MSCPEDNLDFTFQTKIPVNDARLAYTRELPSTKKKNKWFSENHTLLKKEFRQKFSNILLDDDFEQIVVTMISILQSQKKMNKVRILTHEIGNAR